MKKMFIEVQMNKKFILITLLLAMFCVVFLSACNNTPNSNNEQNLNKQEPNKSQETNDKQDSSINELTEQQWKDAVDFACSFDNKTIICFGEFTGPEIGFERTTYYIQIEDVDKLWGGYEKYEVPDPDMSGIIESYYYIEADKSYCYFRENDNPWARREMLGSTTVNDDATLKICFDTVSSFLKDNYCEFTYNREENQYESTSIVIEKQFDEIISGIVKFKDGKMESFKVEGKTGHIRGSITYTFSNYGTTVITLPTEYEEVKGYIPQ